MGDTKWHTQFHIYLQKLKTIKTLSNQQTTVRSSNLTAKQSYQRKLIIWILKTKMIFFKKDKPTLMCPHTKTHRHTHMCTHTHTHTHMCTHTHTHTPHTHTFKHVTATYTQPDPSTWTVTIHIHTYWQYANSWKADTVQPIFFINKIAQITILPPVKAFSFFFFFFVAFLLKNLDFTERRIWNL